MQMLMSYQGLHNRDDGVWFLEGYEEVAAKNARPYIGKDSLVIASFPEPYHFFTRAGTHSLAADPPFIYIDKQLDGRTVTVIDDMGMRQLFPQFSNLLEREFEAHKVAEFRTGVPYRYAADVMEETETVKVYKLKLSELRAALP
jgi:hypothetical protein